MPDIWRGSERYRAWSAGEPQASRLPTRGRTGWVKNLPILPPFLYAHGITGQAATHTHKLGARAFERYHGLDIHVVVARLNAKPSIRIEFGSFVARYADEDYVLGPVQIGLQSAVQRALGLKRQDRGWRIRNEIAERR